MSDDRTFSGPSLWRSLGIPIAFVLLLWLIKLVELGADVSLGNWGIYPRTLHGLVGIVMAPLLHGDWQHLFSNTAPLLVLGFTLINGYPRIATRAIGWIYLLTGAWVWVAARPSFHIGASGVIYGLAAFIFTMGLLRRDRASMALWLLPIYPGVSWESHTLGLIAGIFTAMWYAKVDAPAKREASEPSPEELMRLPYWQYDVEGGIKPHFQASTAPRIKVVYTFKPSTGSSPASSDDDSVVPATKNIDPQAHQERESTPDSP
jgi:membrane associated rhomboid family serine protease